MADTDDAAREAEELLPFDENNSNNVARYVAEHRPAVAAALRERDDYIKKIEAENDRLSGHLLDGVKNAERIAALEAELAQERRNVSALQNANDSFAGLRAEHDALRASEERLAKALGEIPSWLCDKELCGHYLAEEIRELARAALAQRPK